MSEGKNTKLIAEMRGWPLSGYGADETLDIHQRAVDALEAADARKAELPRETCRECRDNLPCGSALPETDFLLWGKLFPREAFGPKCALHATKWFDLSRVDSGSCTTCGRTKSWLPSMTG